MAYKGSLLPFEATGSSVRKGLLGFDDRLSFLSGLRECVIHFRQNLVVWLEPC